MSTRLKRINVCQHCKQPFHPFYKKQQYCSMSCFAPHRGEKTRRHVELKCTRCGRPFTTKAYRATTAKYCSKKCWSQRSPPIHSECEYCEQPFSSYQRDQRFCSRSCARSGTRSNAWKDGLSMKRDRARLAPQLKEWREAIFERDNYLCQYCGQNGKLHAHHIKSWAEYPNLRFEVSNGLTLCIECHGTVHGKDFSNRRKKICPDCGTQTKGRGKDGRCSSCAITLWHFLRATEALNP